MTKKLAVLFMLVAAIGMTSAFAQKSPAKKPTKEEYAKAEKYYDKVKAEYDKNPKSDKAKKTFISTGLSFADLTMKADWLGPKLMYPKALRVYRAVKKADPKNKEANEWIANIEGIYKSMGRPIPK